MCIASFSRVSAWFLLGLFAWSALNGCSVRPAALRVVPVTPAAPVSPSSATFFASDTLAATHGPRVADLREEPDVRVRVARDADLLTVTTDPVVTVAAAGATPLRLAGPVRFARAAGVWRITDARGGVIEFRGRQLEIEPSARGLTLLDHAAYPGRVILLASLGSPDGMDAVNVVGMETYLPGVLQRELFPNWSPAAFEAQAVAARSYALWERARSRLNGKAFDLESTTASQAYAGVAQNPLARNGAAATRGVVLVWDGRVLPAFYASSHGPYGADAHTTFAGRVADLPPLRGQAHGSRDAISPRFHWQASRSAGELAARLQAWGRSNRHAVARVVAPVQNVVLTRRNAAGRHVAYAVTDGAGVAYDIAADQLRHAANHEAPGHASPDAKNRVFSGQFVPVVRGGAVLFTQGHGHGHGVGLSQFGAQALARQGHDYRTILATYYPQAKPTRAY